MFRNVLFYGPPGTGKTMFAKVGRFFTPVFDIIVKKTASQKTTEVGTSLGSFCGKIDE